MTENTQQELEKLKIENEALRKKDILALGIDQVFALKDNQGEIRAFKQRVHLSAAEGTLVQPVFGGPYVISAQGYEQLAEATGTCVIFPNDVLVEGTKKSNPYVDRDAYNGRIKAIHARAIAFRFSSKGIPMVSDWQTIFDVPSYRLIDLLAKAKKFPQAFQLLPKELEPDSTGTWAPYPFDEMTTLYVNTSHPEALQWYSQIINREKKALDFAQTFARRNAVKHLLGLQIVPNQVQNGKTTPINEWNVPILCWRPLNSNIIKWDHTRYIQLKNTVGDLSNSQNNQFAQLEFHSGTERVSDEDGHESMETEIDLEDQAPIEVTPERTETVQVEPQPRPEEPKAKPKTPPPPKREYSDEEKVILSNYTVAKKNFTDEYRQACSELGFDQSIDHDPVRAAQINKRINEILDNAG